MTSFARASTAWRAACRVGNDTSACAVTEAGSGTAGKMYSGA